MLRDTTDKVNTWLDKFKQVGDVAVSFDRDHAALPLAGVRLLSDVRRVFSVLDMPICPASATVKERLEMHRLTGRVLAGNSGKS
jgi:hypothetical protein